MSKDIMPPEEGKKLNLLGDPFICKVVGQDTDQNWSLFEATVMPGSMVPEHKHNGFDEAFYILEGELEMQMDGENLTATKGFFINVRRGSIHSYQNKTSNVVRYLSWTHPAGIEHFYADIDRQVKVIPDDLEKIAGIAEKHQIQLLPPPEN